MILKRYGLDWLRSLEMTSPKEGRGASPGGGGRCGTW
jgi:hypothetical protein